MKLRDAHIPPVHAQQPSTALKRFCKDEHSHRIQIPIRVYINSYMLLFHYSVLL